MPLQELMGKKAVAVELKDKSKLCPALEYH